MIVIQKNIPFPEGSKNEQSIYKRNCIEVLKKMEVGDSIFIERTPATATNYIGKLIRQEKYTSSYADYRVSNGMYGGRFVIRGENNGTRIWRKV